ncbi:hypothetical protein IJT10_01505 [bacterium]|nr:hypothetical protein [bacterium]
MVFVHLLCALLLVALWYVSGFWANKIEKTFFVLCFSGLRGGLLALGICAFIAAILGNGGFFPAPDDSKTAVFLMWTVMLGMIGFPVGFLVGMGLARNNMIKNGEDFKDF